MKKNKIRLRPITCTPSMAATDWGRHTLTPFAGIRFISDTALLIPAHILPITKEYSCCGSICIKTGMEL